MSEVELVLDARALNGENPVWAAREGRLYWIDIEEPALHRFDPRSGSDERWRMPSEIGAFALYEDGVVIAALRTGLMRIDLDRQSSELLALPPYDPLTHRFNDGKCDPQGRFWIGTMWKPMTGQPANGETAATPLYVYDGRQLRATDATAVIANGLAWSPDGRELYWSDSHAKLVRRYPFDGGEGAIGPAREFARTQQGVPDGAAMDEDGFYWVASYDGGRVIRFAPDGAIAEEIPLPVSEPTMCTFGGDDLRDLYVTSASSGLSSEQRAREPLAGGLFRVRTKVRGLPSSDFRPL